MNVREAVFLSVFQGDELKILDTDIGLYTELSQGLRREARYLEFILNRYIKRSPRPKALLILKIALYQFIFLESVPEYVIFSTSKEICRNQNFSEDEIAFVHGVLKNASRDLNTLKEERSSFFAASALGFKGQTVPKPEILSVMYNLPPDILTEVIDASKNFFGSSENAWKALAALKQKPRHLGYLLDERYKDEVVNLGSGLVPEAIEFKSMESLKALTKKKAAWVQGEGSQWASHWAKDLIVEQGTIRVPVHILEMSAGKGGKTLKTLFLLHQCGSEVLQYIHWTVSDCSIAQMDLFFKDVDPYIKKMGIHIDTLIWDWTRAEAPDMKMGTDLNFVWLDAPCSGLGTLSKHPEIAQRIEPKFLARCAENQRIMLRNGARQVRLEGVLFYSVCTLTISETLNQVEWFLLEFPNFELLKQDFAWPMGTDLKKAAQKGSDGFFCAAFKRSK